MNVHSPTISVVVLTNDRPHLLEEALRSLKRQTLRASEIIIVDDSSVRKKETRDVIRRYIPGVPVIIRNTQHSISYGRMLGAKNAASDIVVFLDDDCVATPAYLSAFARHFQSDPDLAAVFGRITNAYPDNVYAATQYAFYDRGLRQFFPKLTGSHMLTNGRILDCEVMGIRSKKLLHYGLAERHRWYRNDDVELGIELVRSGERVLFDADITAASHPRTARIPLWIAAFWNGYSDASTQHIYRVNLRHSPHPLPFVPWFVRQIYTTTRFSGWKKIYYAILLISFPAVSRLGKAWYFITHIL